MILSKKYVEGIVCSHYWAVFNSPINSRAFPQVWQAHDRLFTDDDDLFLEILWGRRGRDHI